jgi:hypothetical protein
MEKPLLLTMENTWQFPAVLPQKANHGKASTGWSDHQRLNSNLTILLDISIIS